MPYPDERHNYEALRVARKVPLREEFPMDHGTEGQEFSYLAPAGYYIALRVGFAFPLAETNALPPAWIDTYTAGGFMLQDPVMQWLYTNVGAIRWSAVALPDPREVLAQAAAHGLRFGAAISCASTGTEGQRSFGSFSDDEIGILSLKLRRLHEAMAPPTNLTEAELEALRMVRAGLLLKEIAARLGVSENAIKQRLKNAKLKLGAKTISQAVSTAVGYALI